MVLAMLLIADGIKFDGTVNLGQILTIGGGIVAFLKMWLGMRDILRDNTRDILGLKEVSRNVCDQVDEHERWLVSAGLDQRSGEERRKRNVKGV